MSYQMYALRRKDFIADIKEAHPAKDGVVVLFAGFEGEERRFTQESSFYYLTGLNEPSLVLVMDLQGKTTLYIPNCMEERSKWVVAPLEMTAEYAKKIGVDEVKLLGSSCNGYQMHPFFPQSEYEQLLKDVDAQLKNSNTMFTFAPETQHGYVEQRLVLQRLQSFGFKPEVIDVSPIVARLRRSKDMHEMELMYKAVDITCLAQDAAAKAISNDMTEAEVQASLEYIIIGSQAEPSFPSIVGSGKNAAILHYTENNGIMKNGDLVVVDIGARYKQYCADITRTYPVSGKFTDRQKEIYTIVLETQEYIAERAKPGVWLSNADKPAESLNHLAKAFIKEKGYEQYFPHGIGHFLGLDVHDVGDYKEPLKEGDVITIEPGIYIKDENIGIRIEDDYWIIKDGAICLSEGLPKSIKEIEQMVQEKFSE
ncbi:MAG: aminopeptidase P family protein [Candidatus Dependentiae bacterium]